jgi:hypothetical protein
MTRSQRAQAVPATRDVITDFQKALDDIDVSGIDANNRTWG